MKNKIISILVILIVILAIGVGVFGFFPKPIKNIIFSKVQLTIDKDAKTYIETIQNSKVNNTNELTYKTLLESQGELHSWTYKEIKKANGRYKIGDKVITFCGDHYNFAFETITFNDSMLVVEFIINKDNHFKVYYSIDETTINDENREKLIEQLKN